MKLNTKWILAGIAMAGALTLFGCSKAGDSTPSPAPGVSASAVQGEKTEEAVTEAVKAATVLKDAYQNDFTVGAAVSMGALMNDDEMEFVMKNYNSITMGNEMKPESLLDWEASEKSKDKMPEIKTENLDKILNRAKELGIKVRGHCLVWHSQTPQWFFSKNYEPSEGYVDKDTMRQRMETYIRKVLTYCQENYPGVVYAWDVTNEVMGDDGWYRTESGWYETYGDESYIKDAFTFARKYADDGAKLFYNDYNEYVVEKRDLIVEVLKDLRKDGLVDGMGMQSHWDMEFPSVDMLADALETYGQIEGLEIQLTEIDMHNTDDSEDGLQAQAERYQEFFETIVNADRNGTANITNVTFWGITDADSWLSGFKGEVSYPLLFDADYKEKPCFDRVLEVAKG